MDAPASRRAILPALGQGEGQTSMLTSDRNHSTLNSQLSTDLVKAFFKIFGIILIVAFVVGLLLGVACGPRANAVRIAHELASRNSETTWRLLSLLRKGSNTRFRRTSGQSRSGSFNLWLSSITCPACSSFSTEADDSRQGCLSCSTRKTNRDQEAVELITIPSGTVCSGAPKRFGHDIFHEARGRTGERPYDSAVITDH